MRNLASALVVTIAAALVVIVSARWGLRAENPPTRLDGPPVKDSRGPSNRVVREEVRPADGAPSLQEALQKPFIMPFGEPTSLTEVVRHLRMILKAPVVLDLAALRRQDLTAEQTVQLELHGVRLKTGLKLLLDQVGLTYQVVPEDNLLIVTDALGAEDPYGRILAELKALRHDLREVREDLEDVRAQFGLDDGPKMRKPTIIEEMPEEGAKKSATPPATSPRTRPGI